MKRELHNVAHVGHSGMCRNDDNGIDCSELQEKYSQLDLKRGFLMSRHFGTSYHPNEHYMRGPGPACAQNARNILKSNARPASLVHAPAGDAGPPFQSSDGGGESRPASTSGSGPLPLTHKTGDACSALEPPIWVTKTIGRRQELKRAVGVAPDPSEARFVLSHTEFLAHMESGSQALENLRTTAFSFLTLGIIAVPFFLAAVVYALFFAPSVASVF